MKGMYGLDVLAKLRELDPAARVIVVSADVQSSSQELVEAAGASGFINKPVDRQQLDSARSAACSKGGPEMKLTPSSRTRSSSC